MRITQGTFSYLPDLTDEQIEAQLSYALRQGWACTDDPEKDEGCGSHRAFSYPLSERS